MQSVYLIVWQRLAARSRNVVMYIPSDNIVRQTIMHFNKVSFRCIWTNNNIRLNFHRFLESSLQARDSKTVAGSQLSDGIFARKYNFYVLSRLVQSLFRKQWLCNTVKRDMDTWMRTYGKYCDGVILVQWRCIRQASFFANLLQAWTRFTPTIGLFLLFPAQ